MKSNKLFIFIIFIIFFFFFFFFKKIDIEENGVKLKLTIVDTPGFGDYVNNENSWQPILENIEARFDAYLEQENRVNRKRLIDTRVHACIYFIPPTGHRYILELKKVIHLLLYFYF